MKTYFQLFVLVGFITVALLSPAVAITKTISASSQQGKLKVSAVQVSQIKSTQAKCTFSVQGSPISEKGVCFSDVPNPTISNKKSMSPGNPTNTGTSIMSGLKIGTTYYVKAYAKSGSEVFYGNEQSFTTTAATDPPKTSGNVGQKVESKPSNSK
jgi:hypothetical protein